MVTEESQKSRPILAILRDIVSSDAGVRARGADKATDLIDEYDDAETLTLTFAMARAYEVETDLSAHEAQLHAFAEFAEHNVLPQLVLLRVVSVNNNALAGWSREHLDFPIEAAHVE